MKYNDFFKMIESRVKSGSPEDVDWIMKILDNADLITTRAVDFHLNYLTNNSGITRLEHYLFKGTQIQRNYCCLFFSRRNEWQLINKAYLEGCIDEIQAYSR